MSAKFTRNTRHLGFSRAVTFSLTALGLNAAKDRGILTGD